MAKKDERLLSLLKEQRAMLTELQKVIDQVKSTVQKIERLVKDADDGNTNH